MSDSTQNALMQKLKPIATIILVAIASYFGITEAELFNNNTDNQNPKTEQTTNVNPANVNAPPTDVPPGNHTNNNNNTNANTTTTNVAPKNNTITPTTDKAPSENTKPKEVAPSPKPMPNTEISDRNIRYHDKKVIFTRHAECRMKCRKLDRYEVAETLAKGKINYRKSKPNDPRGCPTYAIETVTRDNQTARVVIAECEDIVKVVTVIDLKNDYDCYCK